MITYLIIWITMIIVNKIFMAEEPGDNWMD